jgi:hypothetical protein
MLAFRHQREGISLFSPHIFTIILNHTDFFWHLFFCCSIHNEKVEWAVGSIPGKESRFYKLQLQKVLDWKWIHFYYAHHW